MRYFRCQLILCAVFVALFIPPVVTEAQDHDQMIVRTYERQITEAKEVATGWQSEAQWQKSIVVTVAVLGGLIILIQQLGAQKKWCAVSVAFVGFLVTALTAVSNYAFDADYKTLGGVARKAEWLLSTAETNLQALKATTNDGEKADLLEKLDGEMTEFNRYLNQLSSGASLSFVRTAYALEGSGPDWIRVPMSQTFIAYRFSGTAVAASVSEARRMARTNAENVAVSGLRISRDVVTHHAVEVDSYIQYDPTAKLYHYSTLLELNKVWVNH